MGDRILELIEMGGLISVGVWVIYMLVCHVLSDKGAEEVALYQLQKMEEEYLKERK